MLKLCGFAASNYYNKVKFALLEKGVPFEEELAWVGQTDPACSPLGKVPYIKTAQGALCESAVIMEYIEQAYPQNPLLPADPFAAAKVRELVTFLELHLELVARNLYPEAFFGGKISDSAKEKTGAQLEKNVAAFAQLARFAPFVAGVAQMRYPVFVFYNIIGGIIWVCSLTGLGYLIGEHPWVKSNFSIVALAMIIIPGLPALWIFLKELTARFRKR